MTSFSIFSHTSSGEYNLINSFDGEFILSTLNFTKSGSRDFSGDMNGSGRYLSCIVECIEDPLTNLPAYNATYTINGFVVSWSVDNSNAALYRITVRAI
ncbi:hypothetical protein F157LOC_00803 [Pectobacterium brasiliense]|nr:hypothetical protein F157LOC_00803 [Pectobacterium brasiliense]